MKKILIVLALSTTSPACVHAQERDSVKIKTLPDLRPGKKVTTERNNLKLNAQPQDIDKDSKLPENYQPDFAYGKQKNKNSILNFSASYSKFIIPAAMISYGITTRENKSLQTLDQNTHIKVSEHFDKPILIDDYFQYAPAVALYGLDLAGIKARRNIRDRTFIMATSYIIMGTTVRMMKDKIDVVRPDNSNSRSFPSGHTATAFVGAHILFREYKDTSPWIGASGYVIATATGALRVVNKKHWLSDVITGAGIGILSAEASYLLLPVFHNILGINSANKDLFIAPSIGMDHYGVGLAYTF
ncbi:MAG: phosphatase PAP2 family protein [Tannerella sp.]|jgi:membrane-associated phospholipid phosphatase|nr:phosphatase PAP2 family protein [Tannerella sp.]